MELNSIRWQISCLAKLTEAPTTFVEQVHHLFMKKGISLEDDATPYLTALEAAFRREETIRQSRTKASSPQERHRRRLQQLQKIRRSLLAKQNQTVQPKGVAQREAKTSKATGAMPRLQRETVPMVPGPEDLQ